MLSALVAVLIVIFMAHTTYLSYRLGRLPDASKLPLIATIQLIWLSLKYPTYELFTKFAEKYGPVYFPRLFTANLVALSDLELIKKVAATEDWESRPHNDYLLKRSFNEELGIFFGSGDKWRENRRFIIQTLKSLSRTKVMNDVLRTEFDAVIAEINDQNKKNGQPTDIQVKGLFDSCTFNTSWFNLMGKTFKRDDPRLEELCQLAEDLVTAFTPVSNIYVLVPFLDHVIPGGPLRETHEKFYTIVADMMLEARRDGSYLKDPKCFFDLYLKEIDHRKEAGIPPGPFFDKEFMVTFTDMLMAGSETTASTMEAGILSLILFPRVQKKIQEEIDRVVGSDRSPDFTDISNMPYTHATVLETLRIAPVVPGTVRYAHKETRFGKYTFAPKTIGLLNIYGCHMDPKNWDNPREFRPERFLDDNMNIVNADKILAFSYGRRRCPGESIARSAIFTFIAKIMQRYTVEESPEKPAEGVWMQYRDGFVLKLLPYYARFVPRDSTYS